MYTRNAEVVSESRISSQRIERRHDDGKELRILMLCLHTKRVYVWLGREPRDPRGCEDVDAWRYCHGETKFVSLVTYHFKAACRITHLMLA